MREERRVVSVLFADLAGSTQLAEVLDAEEVKLIVNEAISRAIGVVETYGGTVKDLAGDGLLALFGAPLAHEDDPERAVRAGLEIAAAVSEYALEVERGWGVASFGCRVAIHSGPVVVGDIGAGSRVEYGAVGDAVNTAARLQGQAPIGGVLVSETTRRQVEELFDWAEPARFELKGKAEPVIASRVLGSRSTSPSASAQDDAAILTGRDSELERCAELAAGLARGSGGVLFIVGEAGIGKSRLAGELARQISSHRLRWLEGRCVSYGSALSYWPYRDLLRNWLEISGQQADVRTRIVLRRRLEELFGSEAAERLPYLAAILGIQLEPEAAARLASLSAESIQYRTFEVVLDLVGQLAARGPLAILLDDLHWADPTSLALTERLVALVEESSLLLVFTTRPETDHPSWALKERTEREYRHLFVDISLQPLSADSERLLLRSLLGSTPSAAVEDTLLGYAEGNPFFLEELVSDLRERGMAEDGSVHVPATVEAAIVARLDRLDASARRALLAGSILGRSFPLPLLAAVAEMDGDLRPVLHELLRRGLLREERRWPEPIYRFKHALIQDTGARSLVAGERRRLHQLAASWYEEHYADSLERVYGLLAHHWGGAEDEERAVRYLALAAERARGEWALDEAIEHYAALVPRLERLDRRRDLSFALLRLGHALHLALRFAEANDAWQRAFQDWEYEEADVPSPETLRVGVRRMPWDLDPVKGFFTANMRVAASLTDSLVDLIDGTLVPKLARSWQVSPDGRRYRFRIREGARWNDGRPFVAGDVVAGIVNALGGALLDRTSLSAISGADAYSRGELAAEEIGVTAIGDDEVVFDLSRPVPYFLEIVMFPYAAGYRLDGVRNGPYRLLEASDEKIVLERDPGHVHWRGGNAGRVEISPDEDFTKLQAGVLDTSLDLPPLDVIEAGGLNVSITPFLMSAFYLWRGGSDLRLRLAIAHATDRTLIESHPMAGRISATGGLVPPAVPGHTPGIALPFDPDRARHLLRESGRRDPIRITVSNEQAAPLHEALRSAWEEILGIPFVIRHLPMAVAGWKHEDDLTFWHWWAGHTDPEYFLTHLLHSRSGTNKSGFASPRLDDLLDRAAAGADGALRLSLFHESDRLVVHEEATALVLQYAALGTAAQPWVSATSNIFVPLFDRLRIQRP